MLQETSTPGADGASLGAVNIKVDRAGPWLGDDIRGLLQDFVMRGTGLGATLSIVPGDVTLAPRSSGAMGPRLS
jgi:hypothetical protein